MNCVPLSMKKEQKEPAINMKEKLLCFDCLDGHYEPINRVYESSLPDGNTLSIPDIEILTCVKCGDECLDSENSKKIDKAREQYK